MLALLAFEYVCGLQLVRARQSGVADHSLSVPVEESWLSRSLAGAIRHPNCMAQMPACRHDLRSPSKLLEGVGVGRFEALRGFPRRAPEGRPPRAPRWSAATRLPRDERSSL